MELIKTLLLSSEKRAELLDILTDRRHICASCWLLEDLVDEELLYKMILKRNKGRLSTELVIQRMMQYLARREQQAEGRLGGEAVGIVIEEIGKGRNKIQLMVFIPGASSNRDIWRGSVTWTSIGLLAL